jgi:tripartite-type tricarboxylate transporter receptor subunit TctC
MTRNFRSLLAACALLTFSLPAQAWPDKPLRMVVPFAAGGTTDVIARIVAERLTAKFGTSIVVENVGGAGGNTGATIVAKAENDAHTFLMATPGPAIMNQFMYARMPYDTASAFAPVAFVTSIPSVLIVNSNADYKNLRDFIAAAKQNPQKFNFGSAGNGSTGHLGGAILNVLAGVDTRHVPYRGSAPMLQDLISGNIQYTIDSLPGIISFIQAGSVRALAVTADKRASQLPDVPNSTEAGLPDLKVSTWLCLLAPAATPRDVVTRFNEMVNSVLTEPEVSARLATLGANVEPGIKSPQDLARFLAAEQPTWKRMVEAAGARIE